MQKGPREQERAGQTRAGLTQGTAGDLDLVRTVTFFLLSYLLTRFRCLFGRQALAKTADFIDEKKVVLREESAALEKRF